MPSRQLIDRCAPPGIRRENDGDPRVNSAPTSSTHNQLAEAAIFHAIRGIRPCKKIWTQLVTLETSGLGSIFEKKVASVAVEMAAALSKAAAAAAKVSADTALDAKRLVVPEPMSTTAQTSIARPGSLCAGSSSNSGSIASGESTTNNHGILLREIQRLEEVLLKATQIFAEGTSVAELVKSSPDGCNEQHVSSEMLTKSSDVAGTETAHIVGAEGADRSCTLTVQSNKSQVHEESWRNGINGFLIKGDTSLKKQASLDSLISEFDQSVDARGTSVSEYVGCKRKASSPEADVLAKGKVVYSGKMQDKREKELVNNNNSKKLLFEASESRRSGRKFQPTSKWLESMEIPFFSEKSKSSKGKKDGR